MNKKSVNIIQYQTLAYGYYLVLFYEDKSVDIIDIFRKISPLGIFPLFNVLTFIKIDEENSRFDILLHDFNILSRKITLS